MTERRNLGRGTCRVCGEEYNLTSNRRIRSHGPRDNRCAGGSDHPVDVEVISSDGTSTPVLDNPNPHRAPLTPEEMRPVAPTVQEAPSANPDPAPFTTAVPVSATPTIRGGESVRTGPEKSDFDQWGRYKIPDPATGKVSGRQRVTTFVKMISDQWGLSQWQQRVLLVGAAYNPAIAATAAGRDAKADKAFLDGVVTILKDAAGSKEAAAFGTRMHTHTERLDLGIMTEQEFAALPDSEARDLFAYKEAVEAAGLVVEREMVERTTMVRSLDVTGTMDRVFKLPNGDYVIGDVKTGQDLSYGWLDIGMQLACYAQGINENGVFDWASRQWIPGPKVRTDFAIVMHMPAGKGTCTLYRVDINQGWANCALARSVRDARKVRNHAEVLDLSAVAMRPEVSLPGDYIQESANRADENDRKEAHRNRCPVCDYFTETFTDMDHHMAVQHPGIWEDTSGEDERMVMPLEVQPHSESFGSQAVPEPAPDPRDKARAAMHAVKDKGAAAQVYRFAAEVWPADTAFLAELVEIGKTAIIPF